MHSAPFCVVELQGCLCSPWLLRGGHICNNRNYAMSHKPSLCPDDASVQHSLKLCLHCKSSGEKAWLLKIRLDPIRLFHDQVLSEVWPSTWSDINSLHYCFRSVIAVAYQHYGKCNSWSTKWKCILKRRWITYKKFRQQFNSSWTPREQNKHDKQLIQSFGQVKKM